MLRFLGFVCIQFLALTELLGQCTIVAKREVCINDLVTFNLSISSGSAVSYDWDFKTFGTSSNASPLMKFTATGKLIVSCTATLAGGQKCSDTHEIYVLPLPRAKMGLDAASKLCVHENNVCFNDSSTKAARGIKKVTLVWGDGNLSQYTQPLPKQWCHTYTDTGQINVNLEIEDSAGCLDKFAMDVHVHPSIVHSFPFTETVFCDSIEYCFNNQTSGGNKITMQWFSIPGRQSVNIQTPWCKILQPNEVLNLMVISTNEYGCKDSTNINYSVPASTFVLKKWRDKVCINELIFGAQVFSIGEEVQWYLNGVVHGIDKVFVANTDARMGMNYVRVQRISGCSGTLLDSFEVVGIQAVGKVYNEDRLTVQDTVFVVDRTVQKKGSKIVRLWDFGDNYAAKCTTWTARGWNVGVNCNYSMDSIAKHFYPDSQCYAPRLIIYDSVSGCFDDTLMPVYRKKTCPDFYMTPKVCIGDPAGFGLPNSIYRKSLDSNFLIPDLHNPKDTIVMYGGNASYTYTSLGYKSPVFWWYHGPDTVWTQVGDKMVIWFIRPARGWKADTFLNGVQVIRRSNADAVVTKISDCNPFKMRITFKDSTWYYPDSMYIDWGDTFELYNAYTDSVTVLHSMDHEYKTGGKYIITIALYPTLGCSDVVTKEVLFSHEANFKYQFKCPNEPVCFFDSIINLGSEDRWKPPLNDYGQLYWDFGDGTKDTGFQMCHVFPGVGNYNVTLTARSKSGCDVVAKSMLRLTGPVAGIKHSNTIYCSEIKQYSDSSFVLLPNNGQVINQWFWDFSDGSIISTVRNPAHVFQGGGNYPVKLRVKTNLGCMDSTVKIFNVIGPEVKAAILYDSVGCAPLRIDFGNFSRQSQNFIWQFGDPKNTVYSTDQDTNTNFTYKTPGTFYVHVIGGGSFYNPTTGSTYFCSVRYPGPGQSPMKITVYPSALASFKSPDIVCVRDSVFFVNTSSGDSLQYRWVFGNGDSALRYLDSFSYKYNSTGKYTVRLYAELKTGISPDCLDTAEKEIQVIILQPDFKQECNTGNGTELVLKNLSQLHIDGYRWTLLDPADSSETLLSETFDLVHDFPGETGIKWICLGLSNDQACGGKICKPVFLQGDIFMANVFTPGKDGFNDTYRVPILGYETFHLKIFNRWGERIFESNDPALEWNGKVFNTGPELPSGSYFYRMTYRTSCDAKEKAVSGSITLIR